MTSSPDLSDTRMRTCRRHLATSYAIWLIALLGLPSVALAQFSNPETRTGTSNRFRSEEAASVPQAGVLGSDFEDSGDPPAPQEPLDWSPNPGAFEQALRRRVSNPLFPSERQRVQAAELRAAKIRDASDARAILSQFVEFSLERRKLARVKTIEEIDHALGRYQAVLLRVIGVGGEVTSLVGGLKLSRAALIDQWRVAHEDDPEILTALDTLLESDALNDPAAHSEFAAQLQREDGPIRPEELAPALLSESPHTVELVLATLSPERRDEIRIAALELIETLQSLGVEIQDELAKVELLLAETEVTD